jgi:Dolichyl-phosphate-mannose-protein mannosyltransferase
VSGTGFASDRRWDLARFGALAAFLVCACGLGFRSPGLYYDEAIFLNGAVKMLAPGHEIPFAHDPWSWITVFGREWPVMVLPYVGPLRSYLALIPFSIYGPNYFTARILTMLIGAFGIWGFSVLVRDQFDARTAALASWMLAIHPSYLAFTVYDHGGVAEWMLPFALLSIALARYLRSRTAHRAFWLGVAMGFGVWSRANIAWLLASALLAGLLALGKRMATPLRQLSAMAAGGLMGAAPLIFYEIRSRGATLAYLRSTDVGGSLLDLAVRRLGLLSQTLLFAGEVRKAWSGPPLPLWQILFVSAIVAGALAAGLFTRGASRVAALTFIFLTACLLFSRLNVLEHHLITLVPIAAALMAAAAQDTWRRSRMARYVLGAVAVTYFGAALYWNVTAAHQIRSTGGVGIWSNAIDKLGSYLLRNYPKREVKVLDWGLNNNLYVLSNGRIASMEIFWGATAERSGTGNLWIDEITPGIVYVLHAPEVAVFPAAGDGFRRALAASSLPFRRTRIVQSGGAPYAEAVEILPSLSARERLLSNNGIKSGSIVIQ